MPADFLKKYVFNFFSKPQAFDPWCLTLEKPQAFDPL